MKKKRSRLATANYFDEMMYGAGKHEHYSSGMFSFLRENWRVVAYSLKS